MTFELTISPRADDTFEVEVRGSSTQTHHVVSVPPGLSEQLGLDPLEPSELVRASFDFLLEREPPSAILPTFSLEVIGKYFPSYMAEMTERLG